ncbi:MAG: TetR/AcrR family transcriptional regulator [Myxococcota bacterium]
MTGASRGPEAVKAALIEAAIDLFARDGDASVRAVAAHAGVNHGLVHHYFGGKAGLRTAVLDRLAASLHQSLDMAADSCPREVNRAALRVAEQDPRMIKILARALLDGESPRRLQSSFPVVERLLAVPRPVDRDTARALLAEGLALALGSMVFGPWIATALGLDDEQFDAIRRDAIEHNLDRLEGRGPTTR